jgi:hypothetical protein
MMGFLGNLRKLNAREMRWLDRRTRDASGLGVPDEVRNKIVKLGLGVPEGLHSFRLTQKGESYLRKYGEPRSH